MSFYHIGQKFGKRKVWRILPNHQTFCNSTIISILIFLPKFCPKHQLCHAIICNRMNFNCLSYRVKVTSVIFANCIVYFCYNIISSAETIYGCSDYSFKMMVFAKL